MTDGGMLLKWEEERFSRGKSRHENDVGMQAQDEEGKEEKMERKESKYG